MSPIRKLFSIFNKKSGVQIKIVDSEADFFVYQIVFQGIIIEAQCFLRIEEKKLFLTRLDIHSYGPTQTLSKTTIRELAGAFGKKYNCDTIVIEGGRRTTGKTKGQVPRPIIIRL